MTGYQPDVRKRKHGATYQFFSKTRLLSPVPKKKTCYRGVCPKTHERYSTPSHILSINPTDSLPPCQLVKDPTRPHRSLRNRQLQAVLPDLHPSTLLKRAIYLTSKQLSINAEQKERLLAKSSQYIQPTPCHCVNSSGILLGLAEGMPGA